MCTFPIYTHFTLPFADADFCAWRSLLVGPGCRHVWQGSDKDEEGRAVREGACDTAFVFCALSQVNEEIKKYRKKEAHATLPLSSACCNGLSLKSALNSGFIDGM